MINQLFDMVIDAANKQRGAYHCDELRDALNAVAEIPRDHGMALRLKIADAMSNVSSPSGAGMLAVWLGASVESGIDPGPTVDPVVETLQRWTRSFETTTDEDQDDPEPDSDAVVGTELMGQSLVAHLSRSEEWREQLSADVHFVSELERVEHLTVGATWVLELLRKCSGHLMILHAIEPVGVRVRYQNLSNCFHLFTLVQAALADTMPGSGEVADDLVAVALGEADYEENVSDQAWWHFGQGTAPAPDIVSSVFGEASPSSISTVDGEQVMLLWPPILKGRSWDAGFFLPQLSAATPSLTIEEELTTQQVMQWREKLKLNS